MYTCLFIFLFSDTVDYIFTGAEVFYGVYYASDINVLWDDLRCPSPTASIGECYASNATKYSRCEKELMPAYAHVKCEYGEI